MKLCKTSGHVDQYRRAHHSCIRRSSCSVRGPVLTSIMLRRLLCPARTHSLSGHNREPHSLAWARSPKSGRNYYLRAAWAGVAESVSCFSVLLSMLGTRASEKPARKHQNVSNARDSDGITNVIGTALPPGTTTNSMLILSKIGKRAPLAIPDRRKK